MRKRTAERTELMRGLGSKMGLKMGLKSAERTEMMRALTTGIHSGTQTAVQK